MTQRIVAEAGVLFAALLAGLTGFGFNLLSVPLLSLVYEPHQVVALSLLLGLLTSGGSLLSADLRTQVDVGLTSQLFGFSLLGLPLGGLLFAAISPTLLSLVIGVITISYASLSLLKIGPRLPVPRYFAGGAGMLSGLLSASTGLSGPPAVALAHALRLAPDPFRATLTAYVFLVTLATLPVLWIGGFLDSSTLTEALGFVPAAIVGLVSGRFLFSRVPPGRFDRVVVAGLVAMGLLNIVTVIRSSGWELARGFPALLVPTAGV